MASRKVHCQDCIDVLGESFNHIHAWLDGKACVKGKLNVNHRRWRHHTEAVEEIREEHGDRAAEAAIIHLKRDFDGEVPTKEQVEEWFPEEPELFNFPFDDNR